MEQRQPAEQPPDLFGSEMATDPYPRYAALRARWPVHRVRHPDGIDAWLVSRYADVRAALCDPRLSKDPAHARDQLQRLLPAGTSLSGPVARNAIGTDPPEHRRLRAPLSKAFTARRVSRLRPRIEQIADELVDEFASSGTADLIADYAQRLPLLVMAELLGLPSSWLTEIGLGEIEPRVSYLGTLPPSCEQIRRVHNCCRKALEEHADPRGEPDLISALVAAHREDGGLTADELEGTVALLITAGFETTVNLIGNAAHALLTNPAQLDLLRDRPELLPSAIEECLRFDAPADKATFRVAMEDVEYSGTTIPKGGIVALLLASANHDERVFADPGRLDITRDATAHLSFGRGPHFCVGAHLGRVEAEIALRTLLRRCNDLRVSPRFEEPRWWSAGNLRGIRELPVHFTPVQ